MSQNLQKLTSDLEAEFDQLKQQTADAERRKVVAENTASSLEERNKIQIATAEAEVQAYKQSLIQKANNDIEKLNDQIPILQTTKQQLLDDIEQVNQEKTAILTQKDELESEHSALVTSVEQQQSELANLDGELIEVQEMLTDRRGKVEVLKQEITELDYTLEQMRNDKDALQEQLDNIGKEIIESDLELRTQKKYKEDELYELNERLRKARVSLQEAEIKDKEMRKQWAGEKLKLDKRTEAVQRMEARLSGAQERIEELNRFGAL